VASRALDTVITLDTSGILAVTNRSDRHHRLATAALQADSGPWMVPAGILGEVGYMLDTILGSRSLDAFLADVEAGVYLVEWRPDDVQDIRQLVSRYASLPLGFSDACVITCAAMRTARRVLTLDRRGFQVVGREIPLELLP
jgi:predicted nucleic acid-binding protein